MQEKIMDDKVKALAQKLLKTGFDDLPERERRIIRRLSNRVHISTDINVAYDEQRTLGERLSDRVAAVGGSWTFIIVFAGVLMAWMLLNSQVLTHLGLVFDPYPYIFLNLLLSTLAAIQAPVIMMSQNRQADKDRLAAAHDYEVNLKAELEILQLHEKLDDLRQAQWEGLLQIQREQIGALTEIKLRLPPAAGSSA
jgi:uncharacterized membrane protein